VNEEQFIIRKQSDRAYTFGVGEVVIPDVVLFRTGEYSLSLEEAKALLARKTQVKKAH